jgi:serine protease Do
MLSVEQSRRIQIGLRLGWRDRVYVVEVSGPAEKAGVEVGDEVLRVDGLPIRQDLDYYVHVLNADARKALTLELKRGEKRLTATIQPKAIPVPDAAELMLKKFGLVVQPLTAAQAKQLDLSGGLLITEVEAGSPADQAGFRENLIIVGIGRYFPSDMEELGLLLERVRRGEKVRFRVYQMQRQYIQVLEGELAAR